MTTVEISRKKIIQAILKEPVDTLKGGYWVTEDKQGVKQLVKNKTCAVCAVGAVMRNVVLNKYQNIECINDAAQKAASSSDESGKWMLKLSDFFENHYWNNRSNFENDWSLSLNKRRKLLRAATEKTRKETIKFVKENFPEKILININGSKPAADVKVVSK